MAAETSIPGLELIDFADVVNAYVLRTDSGTVLVDTGLPGMGALLERVQPDLIVITHGHMDHSGGLEDVRAATGAPVAAHPVDAELMATGETGRPMIAADHCPDDLRQMITQRFTIAPATFDVLLEDGATVPGFPELTVVYAPGHSAGQVALLWDHADGVLIAADAAGNPGILAPPPVAEDHDLAADTLRDLARLEFGAAVFGHGQPIEAGAADAFRAAFADSSSRHRR